MRLTCPYCGERDHSEFTYRGDAAPRRPVSPPRNRGEVAAAGLDVAMFDYVYIRENRFGTMRELWQHSSGCRAWLEVERDVTNHAVGPIRPARDIAGEGATR